MTLNIYEGQTGTRPDTDTTRVLVLVERQAREDGLVDWLQAQDGYEPVPTTGQAIGGFDICLFDRRGFRQHEQELLQAKQRAVSGALPYLLVLPESEQSLDWDDIDRSFDAVVDDILRPPLDDIDTRAALDRNRRLRHETVAHEQTNNRLAQFEQTVDAMEHALYITDTDGTIGFVNPAFIEVTGYERTEALGETPAILRSGYHDEEYYEQLWETIAAGEVWEETVVNERKNGEQYQANQTVIPVTDGSGTVENYVAVQTDITDRVNKRKQLEVLDRVLRHNLRNDMNVIQARARMLIQKTGDDLRPHAESILAKSQELVETAKTERRIVRLLTHQHSQSEQHITQVARKTAEEVRQAYPHATLVTDIPDDIRWPVSTELPSALEELLVNAIVHNDTGEPTVRLSVDVHPDWIEIVVADDGPGIPDSETAILTGPDSLDPLFHGSGLGLWLVYWVSRFSQGTLTFTENTPRGSVVTLRIPDSTAGPERLAPGTF